MVSVWDVSFFMGSHRSKTGFSRLFFITMRMLAYITFFGFVLVWGRMSEKIGTPSDRTYNTSELLFKTDRKEHITITSFLCYIT